MSSRRVVILAYEGVQPLDVSGPYDVFAGANQALGADAYRVELAAAQTGPVRSASGLVFHADASLGFGHPFDRLRMDTLLIPGGRGVHATRDDVRTVAWVAHHGARSRRVASVCTGAFLLAEAGLLGDGPVTTHWAWADRLAEEFPDLTVDADPIFTRNGRVWTSAGVTAGIDLALALVEEDHGAAVAQSIARGLVMFLRRPGGQSQFATAVWSAAPEPGPIRAAQDHINAHAGDDLSIEHLARLVGMSPRHFQREFTRQVGQPPGRYADGVRVEAARRDLEEHPDTLVGVIAGRCGFGTAETMRRAFVRQLGVAPDQYRQRFAPTALDPSHRPT